MSNFSSKITEVSVFFTDGCQHCVMKANIIHGIIVSGEVCYFMVWVSYCYHV